MQDRSFATEYDELMRRPRFREMYGTSGYFNVGYWAARPAGLVAACDHLVDEVVKPVPSGARVIVDVGCGLGGGTRRVASHFPRARVVAVNLSHWQLTQVRGRGVRGTVASNAEQMALGGGVADAVLAVESPQHFDTRGRFFAEAYRVLRPGGVISMADMLFNDPDAIGPGMVPAGNRISTIPEYERELAAHGFVEVTVRDITELSWRPWFRQMRRGFVGIAEALQGKEESLSHYVLAVARRPEQDAAG
jgi:ubiquinone/menaquinone biosynthesis C-methylase UbiE